MERKKEQDDRCHNGQVAVRNINPKNILLMFSKKAAEEMRDRIAHLPGMDENIAATIQVRTFHSFLLKINHSKTWCNTSHLE
ncbi:UvrD-helicase domain-containing protein [Marinicrinis lubricantis]|uniref:UvrD-helicase domain-containing protein n=1 Tax=Marinicrinis lubricantis TaxID=2086470 RepID=UPI0039EE8A1E